MPNAGSQRDVRGRSKYCDSLGPSTAHDEPLSSIGLGGRALSGGIHRGGAAALRSSVASSNEVHSFPIKIR